MEREKVVHWVQKLMEKAADPASTDDERDAIQRKVEDLMAKYKVTEMEATTPEEIAGHDMLREDIRFVVPGRASWGYSLAWAIAPIFECRSVRTTGTKNMSFFGYPDDVKTSIYFYRTLQMQIIFAVDATGYMTVRQKDSYAHGMVERIADRMGKAYERVKEVVPAKTKALMVVKEEKVSSFLKSHFPKITNSKLSKSLDEAAFLSGYKDGANVDIADNSKHKIEDE